jgi:hypothetical protein
MRIDEFEGVTKTQLDALEKVLDQVFAKLGIDVEFTRHFLDRVNDERNIKQITIKELGNLFAKEFKKWGKPIAQMGPDAEAVMKDLSSDINLPFALNWNKQSGMLELVAKTVMRKKNFRTPNKEFPVESAELDEDLGSIPPLTDLIVMAVVAQTTVAALKAAFKAGKYALKLKRIADKAGVKLDRAIMGEQGVAESNPFTDARMNAIKAGKKEFTVNGKTYRVTGDTSDEREAIANEAVNRDEYTAKLAAKQKDKFFKAALAALDRLVKSDPRGQDVGGYAFDIARAFQGVNGRELARAYNEIQ